MEIFILIDGFQMTTLYATTDYNKMLNFLIEQGFINEDSIIIETLDRNCTIKAKYGKNWKDKIPVFSLDYVNWILSDDYAVSSYILKD